MKKAQTSAEHPGLVVVLDADALPRMQPSQADSNRWSSLEKGWAIRRLIEIVSRPRPDNCENDGGTNSSKSGLLQRRVCELLVSKRRRGSDRSAFRAK